MEERTTVKMATEAHMRYLAAEAAYELVAGPVCKNLDIKSKIMEDAPGEFDEILKGTKTALFQAVEEFANATLAFVIATNPNALLPSALGTLGLREITTVRMWANMQLEHALDILHCPDHVESCDRQKVLSYCLIRRRDYMSISLEVVAIGKNIIAASAPDRAPSTPTRH